MHDGSICLNGGQVCNRRRGDVESEELGQGRQRLVENERGAVQEPDEGERDGEGLEPQRQGQRKSLQDAQDAEGVGWVEGQVLKEFVCGRGRLVLLGVLSRIAHDGGIPVDAVHVNGEEVRANDVDGSGGSSCTTCGRILLLPGHVQLGAVSMLQASVGRMRELNE